ncbi:hypothetical protein [Photobacterium kishitanii]|uniref:Uncharacterized protein n=1 Tax=Photobacterium kishitanii TaxID=318456 RepID=A0A2T3KLU3_9GAMM|nr:hypothetical protein [Photobacterium kishitanii]PSV00661.1 hypothetical protein C9J27_05850 [Photobacterium kishitanii]
MKIMSFLCNSMNAQAIYQGKKESVRLPLTESCLDRLTRAEDRARIFSFFNPSDQEYVLSTAPVDKGGFIWLREGFCMGVVDKEHKEFCSYPEYYIEQGSSKDYPISKAWCSGKDIVDREDVRWRSATAMTRTLSLATLYVTNVRLEFLQDITDDDILKEGIPSAKACMDEAVGNYRLWWHRYATKKDKLKYGDYPTSDFFENGVKEKNKSFYHSPRMRFSEKWNNHHGNWLENPLVWVVDFEFVKANVDRLMESPELLESLRSDEVWIQ